MRNHIDIKKMKSYLHPKNQKADGSQELVSSKAPFGRASPAASRAASGEALPNVCFRTGFTCEAGSEAVGGLHRQGEAMKSWLHAAYTSI